MRLPFLFLLVLRTLCPCVHSPLFAADSESVRLAEAAVAELEVRVGKASTDSERLAASDSIEAVLISIFPAEETFTYAFPGLKNTGALRSPDGAFRLFNWNVPMHDGSHAYRAMILFPDGEYRLLRGAQSPDRASEGKVLRGEEWYGALVYQIHPVKHKRDTFYTLMAWEGHNRVSTKKILDVLWFGKNREPMFGKPVFVHEDRTYTRRVFEFAASAQMTLTYLPAKEAIVFDDLVPLPGMAEGNLSAYVPGTLHRGYTEQKGEWHYLERVDMTRPKDAETKSQFNFPDRPDLQRKRRPGNPLLPEGK